MAAAITWALGAELCPGWAERGAASPVPSAAAKAGALARDRWLRGDVDGAEKAWRAALALAPGWDEPQAGLAVVYHLRGEKDLALQYYQAVQAVSVGECPPGADEEQQALRKVIIAQEANLAFLINRERRRYGLSLLLPDVAIGRVARQHSEEMRDLQYYGHDSPVEGMGNVADRFMRAFGVRPRCIAENICRRWGLSCRLSDSAVGDSHEGLMKSPGHRANILYPDFQLMGVGIAANRQEEYWITEVFVQPREEPEPQDR